MAIATLSNFRTGLTLIVDGDPWQALRISNM